MLLDGHSANSVAKRLGVSCPTVVRRWKRQQLEKAGPVADAMDSRVKELEAELRRVERERGRFKKSFNQFSAVKSQNDLPGCFVSDRSIGCLGT